MASTQVARFTQHFKTVKLQKTTLLKGIAPIFIPFKAALDKTCLISSQWRQLYRQHTGRVTPFPIHIKSSISMVKRIVCQTIRVLISHRVFDKILSLLRIGPAHHVHEPILKLFHNVPNTLLNNANMLLYQLHLVILTVSFCSCHHNMIKIFVIHYIYVHVLYTQLSW